MPAEQVFIGLTTSGLCAVGMAQQEWLLRETSKGRRLVALCGNRNAVWVLRALLALGVGFGLALASGYINPVRWTTTTAPADHLAQGDRRELPAVVEPCRQREICGSIRTIASLNRTCPISAGSMSEFQNPALRSMQAVVAGGTLNETGF